ncbi:MAG: hypothetical protein AAGE37_01430 [Pseudomonadota bacterium]
MTKLSLFRRVATMFVCLFALPGAASACELIHGLRINVESGSYSVTLNGVFLYDGDDSLSSHERGLTEWLVSGENVVRVEFSGEQGEFAIVQVCAGSFADDGFLSQIKFASPASKELRFVHTAPIDAAYMNADIAGDTGLMDAVQKLQDAAERGDVDALMAMHEPMLADYEKRGGQIDYVRPYMREILSKYPAETEKSLTASAVMGGRVYQVLGPENRSPVEVSGEYEGGTFHWTSGKFWARFEGDWRIVAN